MLSDGERRTLLEMERRLEAEDPWFVARCAHLVPGGTPWWALHGSDVSILLPALLAAVSTAVLWSRRRQEPTCAAPRRRG